MRFLTLNLTELSKSKTFRKSFNILYLFLKRKTIVRKEVMHKTFQEFSKFCCDFQENH